MAMVCLLSVAFGAQSFAYAPGSSMGASTDHIYDPYENTNRKIHRFNVAVDKAILKPVAKGYRAVVPKIGRQGINNFLRNLMTPVTFLNAMLQGNPEEAASTFWRFAVNSTLGFGGIMDVASAAGMEDNIEDFGQTLAVHGVKTGAYIELPFFGPSDSRDVFGRIVDAFTNPFYYSVNNYILAGYKTADVVDSREKTLDITDDIERTSLDPYAAIRSLYLQHREDMIRNGSPAKAAESK